MLLPRVLTAIIGIPLILLLLHTGGLPLAAAMACVSLLCFYELAQLLESAGTAPRRLIAFPAIIVLFCAFVLPAVGDIHSTLNVNTPSVVGLSLTGFIVLAVLAEIFYVQTRSIMHSAATLFAVLFVAWPLAHIVLLREMVPLGREWCFFLFGTLWASDSASYLTGSILGKRRLAPAISPKKTVEGLVGAVLGAVGAASLFWLLFFRPAGIGWGETAILGGLGMGIMGQLSDLAESMIKREAKVKDSSNLLPGHGGLLDRFDSFILTAPLLYYYLVLTN